MVDGWLGRGGSILALYRLLGSIQVLETDSMGDFCFTLIVYSYYSDESSHSCAF